MNVFRSYILSRAKQIIKLLDAHISMWIWLSDEIEFDDFSGPITQYIDFSGNDFDVQYLYVKVSTIQRLIGGDARERESQSNHIPVHIIIIFSFMKNAYIFYGHPWWKCLNPVSQNWIIFLLIQFLGVFAKQQAIVFIPLDMEHSQRTIAVVFFSFHFIRRKSSEENISYDYLILYEMERMQMDIIPE